MSLLRFFTQFLAHPIAIGALNPSGRALSTEACRVSNLKDATVAVELGSGTGSVTRVILEQLSDATKFFTIEINPDFAHYVQQRFPHVDVVEGSAVDLPKLLTERGQTSCDTIISGLPLAGFPDALQDAILDAVDAALAPGGRFVTYTYLWSCYLPRGKRFREKITARFPGLTTSPTVWMNVPPAYLYVVEKPSK